MSKFKGDYLGFTFNGIHSSTFGIVRTSDGSRFNTNLLPTMQDKTLQIPGRPGKVLQSSDYDSKVFQIQYAYDDMTEGQMREMRLWLGDKKIHPLVFDEMPHKTWYAKVSGTATMKWLAFDEGPLKERIYKGEGTIQFTCYDPFAHCSSKYRPTNEDRYSEWWAGSGLDAADEYWEDKDNYEGEGWNTLHEKIFYLYNCGDMESDFTLRIPFSNGVITQGTIKLDSEHQMELDVLRAKGSDYYIVINTKNNLIEGYTIDKKKSGNIYDENIISGGYFKIPVGASTITFKGILGNEASEISHDIEFDYLFL